MRCKKHLSDESSTVGVCATCLRGRLYILIEQQSKSPNQFNPIPDNPNSNFTSNSQQHPQIKKQHHQPPQQPPPLIFPRSVSPYISRRKSEPIQRFYSTPQVATTANDDKKKKQSSGKFGFVSKLFLSRSTSSSKNSTFVSSTNSVFMSSTNSIVINKGMSPETELESVEGSPARWVTRPSPARVRPSPARAASMAFCLSPLVRASPARHWGGGGGEKVGFPCEIRDSVKGKSSESNNNKKPHLGEAASFCANRSRKLADFGRFNLKR